MGKMGKVLPTMIGARVLFFNICLGAILIFVSLIHGIDGGTGSRPCLDPLNIYCKRACIWDRKQQKCNSSDPSKHKCIPDPNDPYRCKKVSLKRAYSAYYHY